MAELGAHAAVTDTPDRDGAIGTPAATRSKLSAHTQNGLLDYGVIFMHRL
jgi:hypothetical protein